MRLKIYIENRFSKILRLMYNNIFQPLFTLTTSFEWLFFWVQIGFLNFASPFCPWQYSPWAHWACSSSVVRCIIYTFWGGGCRIVGREQPAWATWQSSYAGAGGRIYLSGTFRKTSVSSLGGLRPRDFVDLRLK